MLDQPKFNTWNYSMAEYGDDNQALNIEETKDDMSLLRGPTIDSNDFHESHARARLQ